MPNGLTSFKVETLLQQMKVFDPYKFKSYTHQQQNKEPSCTKMSISSFQRGSDILPAPENDFSWRDEHNYPVKIILQKYISLAYYKIIKTSQLLIVMYVT